MNPLKFFEIKPEDRELLKTLDPKYEVLIVRRHRTKPFVYVFAKDKEKPEGNRQGLYSGDGGKTWSHEWER